MTRYFFLPCTWELGLFQKLYVPGSKVSERHPDPDKGLVGPGESEEAGGGAQQCGDQGGLGEVISPCILQGFDRFENRWEFRIESEKVEGKVVEEAVKEEKKIRAEIRDVIRYLKIWQFVKEIQRQKRSEDIPRYSNMLKKSKYNCSGRLQQV